MPGDTGRAEAAPCPEHWPTVSQAGRLLGCGPQRVRELIAKGRLVAVRGPLNFRLVDPTSIARLQRERALAAAQRQQLVAGRAK